MLFDAVGFDEIFGEPVEYRAEYVDSPTQTASEVLPQIGEIFASTESEEAPPTETTTERAYPEYVVQFYRDIEQAKDDLAEAAKRKAELEVELKLAKSKYKEALDYLVTLEKRGPQEPKAVVPPIGGSDPTTEDDGEWRKISTTTVLDGIEGMGTRKRQAVLDEFPTLGELEDARAKAYLAHKPFKDALPKGIGNEMAQRIEDKIGDVICKYAAERQGQPGEVISTSETEEETIEDGMLRVDLRVFDDGESEESEESEGSDEPAEQPEVIEDFSSDEDLLAGL